MNHIKHLHALYGLKWNPFLADVPSESLIKDDSTKKFCWRVEQVVLDGGFALVTGEPGTGKSVTLRHLRDHLKNIPELSVKIISRPQSGLRDFYREISELFEVPITQSNRFGSFANLRAQWKSHIKANLFRPVLLIDEAQEAHDDVLNELRLLSSIDLDSKNILAVVLAGDNRLPEKLRQSSLLPLESRILVRYHLDKRPQNELIHILKEVIKQAGSPELMTPILIQSLAEHSMGNLRAMMLMANELLAAASEKEQRQLDENLFFDVYRNATKKKRTGK
ncbi:MAG: ATP-binding protein [Silvanigrellaceae bacterium]|nr:ATP-binding protein [Silvanigrellaceae bacterium]